MLALAAVIAGAVPAPYMIAIATPFGITQGTMVGHTTLGPLAVYITKSSALKSAPSLNTDKVIAS